MTSSTSIFHMPDFASTPESCLLRGDHWRISLIDDALVRFEWSPRNRFVDEPTQVVVNRDFGVVPEFTVAERDGYIEIDTASLHISYDGGRFTPSGLYATVKGVDAGCNTWHYGDCDGGNLGGTVRTLDTADGAIPLGNGILSRDGWTILDDSLSCMIVSDADSDNPYGAWVRPREDADAIDFYLFAYGRRYREAIRAFYRLAGPTPLLPRFALGNWWSRYHRYTQAEYEALMDRFSEEGIPFSVAVIDMDWHLVDGIDPKYGSGWTGYTWNRELIPDPQGFLAGLHDRGLAVSLNLHPRDGIRAFEEQYPAMAEAMGVDMEHEEAVQFDPSSPKFLSAYFGNVLHPMERDGVDFWWLDWQQGGVSRQVGLDPLWMLNALHYGDSRRDGKPGLTFSRYAGPGSHRYPVGFSGDTVVTWDSLRFQPYFTATASNIGYGWWSHDIGGHMYGVRDEELQGRWYQLGAFSPINRLHSAVSPFTGKEPWNYREPVRSVMRDALRLRHAMLPYLYTMNHRAAHEGMPIVEPMYWSYPEVDDAYHVPNQYMFGTQLMVAPITEPVDRESGRARTDVWLPEGEWFDFFDGRRYHAGAQGRMINVWRSVDRMPVFAAAGGLVPLQDLGVNGASVNVVDNPESMTLLTFPGSDGMFDMVEDDGCGGAVVAVTRCTMTWRTGSGDTELVVRTSGAEGVVPAGRHWTVVFRGVNEVEAGCVAASVAGAERDCVVRYDARTMSLGIAVDGMVGIGELRVMVRGGLTVADDPVMADVRQILHEAQVRYRAKDKAFELLRSQGAAAMPALCAMPLREDGESCALPMSVIGALNEVLYRG